ncbi:uncharacterized protein LOC143233622 isoform X2 [Tachypleus tridentatus]|uniref:uncharacterized protein LOC143233622 isoform X2 n=1 Tax=Tachypleus tridentatus TaxID=6853 RepID=UPI003FD4218A
MVREAVRKGINYIDTSPWYGFGTADVVLGKVHDLEFASSLDIILHETLPALQKIKESGKARFIGITGYPLGVLREVVERSTVKLDSVLSYCRCTLFDQSLLEHIPFFQKHGLGIINAANLGMSLLTEEEIPKWHPALPEIRAACAEAIRYCKDQGVDISKLAICFSLNHLGIDTHLTGMAESAHLEKNLKTLFDGLDAKEETVLEEIQKRFFRPLVVRHWEEVGVKKYWQKLAVKK